MIWPQIQARRGRDMIHDVKECRHAGRFLLNLITFHLFSSPHFPSCCTIPNYGLLYCCINGIFIDSITGSTFTVSQIIRKKNVVTRDWSGESGVPGRY